MVITTTPRFESEMQGIFDFIAKDSKERAKNFAKNSNDKISILGIYKENEWRE